MDLWRNKQIAVIGAGNIGRILLKHLTEAGVPAGQLVVCDSEVAHSQAAAAEFGVRVAVLTDDAVCHADVLLLAVSPKSVIDVLRTLVPHLRPGQVVVSFAAANPLEGLEAIVPAGVAVIRVMPNAPSLVSQGMNPVAYGAKVTAEARALVEALLALLGETVVVRDDQMTWCVGLTGAAMRSLLPVLEGMIRAGMDAGLPESEARRVAAQVMLGTATLALQTELTVDEIKALTPMQTVDEPAVAQLFYDAAHGAKEKVDGMQLKLQEAHTLSS
jgi:pyrroline-5-carboxylate reductase